MKVAVGADSRGFELKEYLKQYLSGEGVEVIDFGAHSAGPSDYPDFGRPVAEAVASGKVDRGLTICWTGNGMNIVANKVHGIRAALALNTDMAQLARAHNDANVLSLAAKYTSEADARAIVDLFLKPPFEGGRHERRVEKISAIEDSEQHAQP